MLSNSFFGLKLKKLITQLAIFFIVIVVFFLLIQTKKNSKKHENFGNTEIIYEKNEFNNELIKKNYYFAKKTYRAETVQIIFKSYFNGNINANLIMNNIKNRRKLNEELYSNNIQFLWRRV